MANSPQTENLPPHAQVIQMGTAYWVSQIVYVGTKLGLPDRLADGPKSADELAAATGTHAPTLYRLMRAMGNLGLLSEDVNRRFALTPLGESLKTGAPGAARAAVLTLAGPVFQQAMGQLLYGVQTGKCGFDHAVGMPAFDWMAQHPEEAALFNETMIAFHGAEPPAVATAYDFSIFPTIVDVGGGTGNLLTTILAKTPRSRGILYDLPHVAKPAAALIQSRNLTDRITIESGSFFDKVPAGGDAYLLSHVIHDWSEPQCLSILGHVRRTMNPTGRLLLVEMVLPPGNTPHPGKMLDIMMLVGPGGQERTEGEYAALLAKAGFKLNRVIATESAVSIVEGIPV